MEPVHIYELVKTGGIIGGMLLTMFIAIMLLKYVVPLLRTNGGGTAPILAAVQQLAGLPGEIKALVVEIKSFNGTISDHVPTKAELFEQFKENRHEMRNIVSEGNTILQDRISELANAQLRSKSRRRKERRK